MQEHALRVGDELVIQGHVRLTVLAVEGDEVLLGITGQADDVRGQVAGQWRPTLTAVPAPLPHDQ
jgi:hypothetical protein